MQLKIIQEKVPLSLFVAYIGPSIDKMTDFTLLKLNGKRTALM